MNKIKASSVFMMMSCATMLLSCNQNQQVHQYPPMELPVEKIQKGNGLVAREYPASIEGITDVEIRPQVSGYLQKILVDEGAYVKAGQLLFKIDDRLYDRVLTTRHTKQDLKSKR
tara:strand:+ start:124 stop:468 length:345 start_codon:yes stop_codon:yes gene_type:complete